MMPFFGKSSKSPSEVVRNLKDSLGLLEKMTEESGKKYDKAQEWRCFGNTFLSGQTLNEGL